jgi:hypothetical protein
LCRAQLPRRFDQHGDLTLSRLLKKSFVSLLVETKARLYVLANYARN